jgi:hypothetical protein
VAELTALPLSFALGDTIDLTLVVSHTGTLRITGTAILQLLDPAAAMVAELS